MRLGILGGSFDPPHAGHLALAARCRDGLALERVLFVPAFQPPHKLERTLTPFDLRLAMVRAAVRGRRGLAGLAIEGERGGVSYTVDTLQELGRRFPGARFWLCMGEDSLVEMESWRDVAGIAALARLAVYRRRGVRGVTPRALRARVDVVAGEPIEISSTELRERIARGEPVERWVPAPVMAIIRRAGLYGAPATAEREED